MVEPKFYKASFSDQDPYANGMKLARDIFEFSLYTKLDFDDKNLWIDLTSMSPNQLISAFVDGFVQKSKEFPVLFKNLRFLNWKCQFPHQQESFQKTLDHLTYPHAPSRLDGIWHHYKGGKYVIFAIADRHEHNGDKDVVYLSLLSGGFNTRPLFRDSRQEDSWTDFIEWPDGMIRQRFIHESDLPVQKINRSQT